MPRTDPITGCQVMTMGEFWQSEAEHEGKGREPFELMADFFQELADDEEHCRQQMLQDTQGAYHNLLRYWNELREDIDWDELDPLGDWRTEGTVDFFVLYKPRRVIEVVHADLKCSFKETTARVVCRVLFSGGRIKLVSHEVYSFSGDFYEPPWGEDNVKVLPDDWEPEDDEE